MNESGLIMENDIFRAKIRHLEAKLAKAWTDEDLRKIDIRMFELEQENKLLREALDWATATQLRSSFNWEKSEKIRKQFKLDGEA